MSILIGNARGGDPTYTPGDQTGAEVRVQAWYLHTGGWHFVARFKDHAKAARAVKFCRAACANPHIGYGQSDRNTLRPLAKAVNWDAAKITQDCNCDCTSFVSVCAEAGGVNMDGAYSGGNAPYSENIQQKLRATGEFEILLDSKYLTSDQYLMCGDIVVNEPMATGHAIMVLENGSQANATTPVQNTNTVSAAKPITIIKPNTTTTSIKEVKASEPAYYRDESLTGQYECTASDFLSVRDGAGKSKTELAQIKPGEIVNTWGYYNTVGNVRWFYVAFTQNGINYIGYACENYLKKL